MEKVALIGASGFVGTKILDELLNRGNVVTAIVRNPEKITNDSANLKVVKADVSDVDAIVAACNEKGTGWVFFSPAGTIEPGQRTGKFRLGKGELIVDENGKSHISVEDYAVALVDEMEQEKHHCERFTIGY